jgi:VIT1/CCC1 family predicted Fe2+/Mn2+ transporter
MALEDVHQRNLHHKAHRSGWLRAAVLGSNDGLVATASLMIGIAAASKNSQLLWTVGVAGIAAGAMSMAVGEYISVKSQADIEESDKQLEIEHLRTDPEGELAELTQIYVERGLSYDLASQVAKVMTEKDALEAHLRDELGQFDHTKARPLQASIASAIAYTLGGSIPLLGAIPSTSTGRIYAIVGFTLLGLLTTGAVGAKTAGSPLLKPTIRVLLGGSAGMAITAGIGNLFHLTGI